MMMTHDLAAMRQKDAAEYPFQYVCRCGREGAFHRDKATALALHGVHATAALAKDSEEAAGRLVTF